MFTGTAPSASVVFSLFFHLRKGGSVELVLTARLVLWVPLVGGSLEWLLETERPVRVVLLVAALGAARCKYIWLCLSYCVCTILYASMTFSW